MSILDAPLQDPAKARARARRLYQRLLAEYPDADCALTYDNPYHLLVATIFSSQCTDERVNMTTPALFAAYPDPAAMAAAPLPRIEKIIQSCGFYRNKAKNIRAASRRLVEEHDGAVPQNMAALLDLPGVARKTANVVLGNAFGINEGVTVDTHAGRLAWRFTLTDADPKNATAVERDLMDLFPRNNWTMLTHLLIAHGRAACTARTKRCTHPICLDYCRNARD